MTKQSSIMKQKNPTLRYSRHRLEVRHIPWILAIPGIVLALALRFIPSAFGVGYSFTDWTGLTLSANAVGFGNYFAIFSDPSMRGAVLNTLLLAFLMVLFANLIGLFLAIILRNHLKLRNFYRALFFLPFALSHLATGYVWQYIFSYDGPVNQVLSFIGLEHMVRPWLADPTWAIFVVAAVLIWQYIGLALVIYLSGLEGIPEEIEDAVAVDGASRWMHFWRVTMPLLAPAFTVSLTLTMVWGLASFDQIIALTGGGPAGATESLATSVWKTTFVSGLYGRGSAFAVLLTILVAVFSVTENALLRRREASL